MRITIDCTDKETSERIRDLLHYNLGTFGTDIANVRISISQEKDALGSSLVRCRMLTRLRSDENIAIEELHSSEEMALTRAIERSSRTLQRKRKVAGASR